MYLLVVHLLVSCSNRCFIFLLFEFYTKIPGNHNTTNDCLVPTLTNIDLERLS